MSFGGQWAVMGGQWSTHAEQSAAARRLLAQLLGYKPVVEHDARGVPFLPAHPEVHISLSHCRTAVAVAISKDGPVGIDIECRRSINDDLVRRVCTGNEIACIDCSDDRTMSFLQLWTRKEAVLKCRGTGIKGFESMVHALEERVSVCDLPSSLPDTVVALAYVTAG